MTAHLPTPRASHALDGADDATTGRSRTPGASHALDGPPADDATTGHLPTPGAWGRAATAALAAAGIAAGLSLSAGAASAGQSQAEPAPEPTPRLADGTPNLGRVAGEKGVWRVPYITNMAARAIGPDGEPLAPPDTPASSRGGRGGSAAEPHIPFMPWSAAIYDYNSENESKYDPEGYCLPPGGPRMMATPYPMEFIQLPEQERIIMIFEGATHVWREIYMDGRPHPEGDALNPTFLGHSVGHWEGDTLVVDVVGFNETSWIDFFGHPHTDRLHLVERFSRPDKNTLRYEATIDDPGAYTEPWTVGWDIPWMPDGELLEYICQDNNLYLYHLTDDFGQPIFGNR